MYINVWLGIFKKDKLIKTLKKLTATSLFKIHILTLNFFFLPQDLNRQVIQANSATIKIPDLDFEIPSGKGGEVYFHLTINISTHMKKITLVEINS